MRYLAIHDSTVNMVEVYEDDPTNTMPGGVGACLAGVNLTQHGTGGTTNEHVEQAIVDGGFKRTSEWSHFNNKSTGKPIPDVRWCYVVFIGIDLGGGVRGEVPGLVMTKAEAPDIESTTDDGQLTTATCPNGHAVASVMLDASHCASGETTMTLEIITDLIQIRPIDNCQHKATICRECLESWKTDYIVTLAPAGTPTPVLDPADEE